MITLEYFETQLRKSIKYLCNVNRYSYYLILIFFHLLVLHILTVFEQCEYSHFKLKRTLHFILLMRL